MDLDSNPRRPTPRGSANLDDFHEFLCIDLQLNEKTVKDHVRQMKRFFQSCNIEPVNVTKKDLRKYLSDFRDKSSYSYKNVLSALKRFFRDYMNMKHVVEGFRFPKKSFKPNIVPNKEEINKFYYAIDGLRARALFVLYASSGLRKNEVLSLKIEDIDFKKRIIIPNSHNGETKKAWLSFFNNETEIILRQYIESRTDSNPKLFPICKDNYHKAWREAREKTSISITPRVLRQWFCSEMGRLGVPDRYVDAFCGRTPKSVLARHYTDYSPRKLKEIYDKAELTVLF